MAQPIQDASIGTPMAIPLAQIVAHPDNPRGEIDTKAPDFQEFLGSIAENGIQIPCTVRVDPDDPSRYQLIYGHRRIAAARACNHATAPCLVRELTDEDALALMHTENADRADLSPIEEGRLVMTLLQRLQDLGKVARALGRNMDWVRARARMANLHPQWLDAQAMDGMLTHWGVTHFEIISRFSPDVQLWVLEQMSRSEGWSLQRASARDLQRWVETTIEHKLSSAPWMPEDSPALNPERGCCADCPARSDREPELFYMGASKEETPKDVRCHDPRCWRVKTEAALAQRIKEERGKDPEVLLITTQDPERESKEGFRRLKVAPLAPYQWEKGLKSDKKAKRALVCAGPGAGSIKYVKPVGSATTKPKPTAPAKSASQAAEERRNCAIMKAARDAIGQAPYSSLAKPGEKGNDALLRLMALASTYGAACMEGRGYTSDFKAQQRKTYEARAADAKAAAQALWIAVRERVGHEVRTWMAPDGDDMKQARYFCDLLGLDWAKFVSAAEEAYPDPKLSKAGGRKSGRSPKDKAASKK